MNKISWGFSQEVAEYDRAKFEEFKGSNDLEGSCKDEKGRLKHIIRAEHFSLDFLQTLCETSLAAKKIDTLEDNYLKGLMRSKSVLNYFSQSSSRTFNSFSMAEANLGMRREEVRDLKTSSTVKGESDKDSLRTLSSYFDVIVCRNESDIFDQLAVWALGISDREIPFINAGSGTKEHPTQALLDYFTSWLSFDGDLDNKVHVMAGDPRRSRTIKSRSKLYALHKNQTFIYVAKPEDQIDDITERYVKNMGVTVEKVSSLRDVVGIANEINMTRRQDEYEPEVHHTKTRYKIIRTDDGEYIELDFSPKKKADPSDQLYPEELIFKAEYLDLMKEGAILTHPLPKRNELDPAIDYLKEHPKVMLWRALRNGMWNRTALLAYLGGKDHLIRDHYQKIKSAAK